MIIALRVPKEGHDSETPTEKTSVRQSFRVILTVEELYRNGEREAKKIVAYANVVVKIKLPVSS